MRAWRTWSQALPAARLRSVTLRTVVRAQEVFTHLDLQTVDDLVVLDVGLADHWRQANVRWSRICAAFRTDDPAGTRPGHGHQVACP